MVASVTAPWPGRALSRPTRLDAALLHGWYRVIGMDVDGRTIFRWRERDPNVAYSLFALLVPVWGVVWGVAALIWLGVWAALRAPNVVSHHAFVPVFFFLVGFCFVAMLDALWRAWLLWPARRHYDRFERGLDDVGVRLMRVAGLNNRVPLLQLMGAVVAAVLAWRWL